MGFRVVLHPLSTSNHNLKAQRPPVPRVVLHPLSTSNHNLFLALRLFLRLYCILFLHQTTTMPLSTYSRSTLYCILFLHQTTTSKLNGRLCRVLYCILFLHQTTTVSTSNKSRNIVVLHPLSTSNHNPWYGIKRRARLYCILFLHQTTTVCGVASVCIGCIASSFYIKPQQISGSGCC